ncbi:MAG: serpin family protein [Kiritimatiellae bacterium]|nr:serpin family protein [Kiritimatiellia bacterium]
MKHFFPILLSALFALPAAQAAPNDLACNLYSRLKSRQGRPGNIFFSPLGVSTVLGMAALGAKGATADELDVFLRLPAIERQDLQDALDACQAPASPVELSLACSLWMDDALPVLPSYTAALQARYDAEIHPADFANAPEAARTGINRWTADRTHDRIRDLLGPGTIQPTTKLVLVNAIYFKGRWQSPFEPKRTEDADFHLFGGSTVSVPLMHQTLDGAACLENDRFQALLLPYKGRTCSMLVLLPREGVPLADLETDLSACNLASWLSAMGHRKVRLWLPRFKMEWGPVDLVPALRAMGLETAFSPAADFSDITGARDLQPDMVIHKAFIEVAEEGTEAAAATAMGFKALGARPAPEPPPVVFRADRPFLFAILENSTRTVLFLGRLENPATP